MASAVELVAGIVKGLVGRPDRVEAEWVSADRRVDLTVSPEDRGKVIGRRGRTIDSLRILASAVFAEPGGRVDVRLREEDDGSGADRPGAD